jgi:hypothetical protein
MLQAIQKSISMTSYGTSAKEVRKFIPINNISDFKKLESELEQRPNLCDQFVSIYISQSKSYSLRNNNQVVTERHADIFSIIPCKHYSEL